MFVLGACTPAGSRATNEIGPDDAGAFDCDDVQFVVLEHSVSDVIPTVGIVEWLLTGGQPSKASIVFELADPSESTLNRGGIAPVELGADTYRTHLLGLKQARSYVFHIEAEVNGSACSSERYTLPNTGALANGAPVPVDVVQPARREPGFIVTSSGTSLPHRAFIIDADGEIVWQAEGSTNTTRALMDYEGKRMWMLSLNLTNERGEMRYISMDGQEQARNVPGLETAHHDFTVLPGGAVAALAWDGPGIDVPSKLIVRSTDGTVTSPFRIGSNLYRADAYHANALHYVPFDDSYTISDRNPSVFVKVSASGELQWQLGGTCESAPSRGRCVPRTWEVTHGHHLTDDGTFVVFNNTYDAASRGLEFKLEASEDAFTAALVRDYAGEAHSPNLGDIQRLPGGNTLITYSADGSIAELDASWEVVQRLSVRVGYTSWRPTLYGAPPRP